MKISFTAVALLACLSTSSQMAADAFTVMPCTSVRSSTVVAAPFRLAAAQPDSPDPAAESGEPSKEEKDEAVGNLLANDEWDGLGMELSEIVKVAVVEDLKKNARDFLGKDEYKVGDICKEVDTRVKGEVAKMRGKDEYELGDFVLAMDDMSKSVTEDLTGKPYEAGDLSREIDSRVKDKVSDFTGKPYEAGDLSKEIDRRVKNRVNEFTGKDEYEFGDIAKEVEERRKVWVKDFLGEEAAANYQFGDVTKEAISRFTGKDKYEFGDVTKKIMGNLFGTKKKDGK
uniref:Uncharacterized protein n=1 Tax=Craspedostauros australis TaxID=1486917 RepID=A0A7R9ZSP6_9STRA